MTAQKSADRGASGVGDGVVTNEMDILDNNLDAALEGLLVVLDRPIVAEEVAQIWGLDTDRVRVTLVRLQANYERSRRGFALRETTSGWRLFCAPEVMLRVQEVAARERSTRLSAAALETLAVVAYQQPVGRARIASVRGVNSDAVLRTLTTRGLIDVVARDEVTGASLYGTTEQFLEALGVQTLDDLPELAPLLPDISTISSLDGEGST